MKPERPRAPAPTDRLVDERGRATAVYLAWMRAITAAALRSERAIGRLETSGALPGGWDDA